MTSNSFYSMRRDVVLHPAFKTAVSKIEQLHLRHKETGDSKNLLLTGQSGAGKDTVIEYYTRKHQAFESEDRTIRPVLCVETPSAPTVKSLVQAIQLELSGKIISGSAEYQTQRVYTLVKECGVEITFFNELQHVVDRKREHEMLKIADWLKNYINAVRTPVVLVGLPRIKRLLEANEQLRRRCSASCHLSAFGYETKEEQRLFRGILGDLQRGLPMGCTSLEGQKVAQRIHFATNGIFDYIIKLLEGAVETALARGDKDMQLNHFHQAFIAEIWNGAPEELNPFSEKFVLRRIDRHGEPFCPADDFYVAPQTASAKGLFR